ncbi:MAG: ATP-binding protein [Desulfobulbus sp.]|jgi:two-component system cell cycle sensor histidine kinase/response regulator CckA
MKHSLSRRIFPIILLVLFLAGLFYLPWRAVRTTTIDSFIDRQTLVAQQAGAELDAYFTTYGKALRHLGEQESIQAMTEAGSLFLRDFFSMHPGNITGIHRYSAAGEPLFTFPCLSGKKNTSADWCAHVQDRKTPTLGALVGEPGGDLLLPFATAVFKNGVWDGCLAFAVPYAGLLERVARAMPLPRNSSVMVFDGAGRLLYGPDAALAGSFPDALPGVPEDLALLWEQISRNESAFFALSRDPWSTAEDRGGRVAVVVYPVAVPGGASWPLVLVTPMDEVLAPMATFQTWWGVFAGCTVAALFLAGLAALRGVSPVRPVWRRPASGVVIQGPDQLADLLDLAPMAVFLLDEDYRVIHANPEAGLLVPALSGTDDSVFGRYFTELLTEESGSVFMERMAARDPGQAVRIAGLRLAAEADSIRELVLTATPCCQLFEGPAREIVVVRDVSEKRRAEDWRRRLITAIEQVQEGVLMIDALGRIEYINTSMAEMTGYGREECVGRFLRTLWAPEQETGFEESLRRVFEENELWRGRIVNQRKDGEVFVAAATITPVRAAMGSVVYFVLVQHDITAEVEVEGRLQQAQKMEAIGTLAGGIAHDFNNILGAIIGFTDMALLQCPEDSPLYDSLRHIRQGGRRAADLVQQILTFSRQSVQEKTPVIVAPLIKESLKLMRATLPSTIAIERQLLTADATVMAAPVQLQQIVMNLCSNAFYAMKEKGGRLTVRLSLDRDEADREWVVLLVADTGEGMESETLQRVFTPFFTTKKPGEGTGMGLSVVHGIVRDLGGSISVQSEPDRGTTFVVRLPSVREERKGGAPTPAEQPLPTGREHVLVVDDEVDILEICRLMLDHLGYTVSTVQEPDAVLQLLAEADPPVDLVVTDQTMPKITGLELTKAIKELYPNLPVILCTGYSDRLNHEIALDAGASDLMMKPVDLHSLSVAVRSVLDGRS